MSTEAVHPLRIQKNPTSSPFRPKSSALPRPLTEISPMERRRNSPSFQQGKMALNRESSPFDSSPYHKNSPHSFWKEREVTASPSLFSSENDFSRDLSPSAAKRRSIENLMKASRVKNSSMFAREHKNEYDPTSTPVVERPLAAGRPLSLMTTNAFSPRPESPAPSNPAYRGHRRGESQNKIPLLSPTKVASTFKENSPSPRDTGSPTKSSLANKNNTLPRNFNPYKQDNWSDETVSKVEPQRPLRRHAKSVTFDTAPPEINEYEMVTPDPSSVASGSREGSYDMDLEDEEVSFDNTYSDHDDSFDASLEDTDKTPIVLPGDWNMTPDPGNATLTSKFHDSFGKSDTPSRQWHAYRTASVNSDESRPLPPLPSGDNSFNAGPAQRSLPQLPDVRTGSQGDVLGMKEHAMELEDRLRLMEIRDSPQPTEKSHYTENALHIKKNGLGIQIHEEEVEVEQEVQVKCEQSTDEDYEPKPISRESILRKVKSRTFHYDGREYGPLEDEEDYLNLDPDVPIPSREASSNFDEVVQDAEIRAQIKMEEEEIDLYSIPELYARSPESEEHEEREGSVIRHPMPEYDDDDDASQYSQQHSEEPTQQSNGSAEDDGPPTPKIESGISTSTPHKEDASQILPDFPSMLDDSNFGTGFEAYMSSTSTPPPPPPKDEFKQETTRALPALEPVQKFFERPQTPERQITPEYDDTESEPSTPTSVVHRPMDREEEEERAPSPVVPERHATIKAPGSGLKTRPSATPADIQAMAATRRQVSGQIAPPIPDKSPKRFSMSLEPEPQPEEFEEGTSSEGSEETENGNGSPKRRESFKMKLDLPDTLEWGEDLSFGLDKEFDRVIESSKVDFLQPRLRVPSSTPASHAAARGMMRRDPSRTHHANPLSYKKKGYLMRQNTKVVVAKRNFSNELPPPGSPTRPSSAHSVSAHPAQRKPSHERTKSWTTEPWNPKARRKSGRTPSGKRQSMGPPMGPAPPMPGQESAVSNNLGTVVEGQMMGVEEMEEGAERGRLFVKVVGVKNLELPLPTSERTYFQLTLDNGLHCVTTSWLELGKTAPIAQEFELVVLSDLEFQLTLQTKLTPPPKMAPPITPSSPTKAKAPIKKSSFSRFLSSPKKRREAERQAAAEEEDRQTRAHRAALDAQRRAAQLNPSAWDLLHELVGGDGSFGRAYVSLKSHEQGCFGRPFTVDVPVFNEWALEQDAAIASSVKSKRAGGAARRPPYKVAELELQLLFVPRVKGARDEDLPKSMNACVREMREAEEEGKREWEGFLSQQGGDCPYWRRRFFRLQGTQFTAFHETTRQPRAKIDLSKATKLIDDKSALMKPDGAKASKGRRKSAFGEEEEGYMFVEEGFRIRFANGEIIDFYADNEKDKAGWMAVLAKTVGREAGAGSKGWCRAVLERERRARSAARKANGLPEQQVQGTRSVPVSPRKPSREAPAVMQAQMEREGVEQRRERRKQVQSMIF
ncbi:DUF1709-domain-containing protein [Trichodelitschia bisporula]|uniref:DUF1709-domain-containing protein n=1 Tax=Trichodelitschia bisporula TaxID=703511 RepID=A0A6G1HYA3_9PEZI|nr:DUF1709-domain-containing protein [Trichodelitschia bisporula]